MNLPGRVPHAIAFTALIAAAAAVLPASANAAGARTTAPAVVVPVSGTHPVTGACAIARLLASGVVPGVARPGAGRASARPAGAGRMTIPAGTRGFARAQLAVGEYALRHQLCPGLGGAAAVKVSPILSGALAPAASGGLAPRVSGGPVLPGGQRPALATAMPSPAPQPQRRTAAWVRAQLSTPAAGGGISGKVTGPNGKPVAGICWEVFSSSWGLGGPVNKNGSYSTGKNIPAGRYHVAFTATCDPYGNPSGNWATEFYRNRFQPSVADPVTVRAGALTKGINAVMRPGGVIVGLVTGPTGRGVAGVCVVVVTPSGNLVGQATTAKGGGYRAVALDPGKYLVGFFPDCGNGGSDYLPQWWPGFASHTRAHLVSVSFGTVQDDIGARLVVGGQITGVVRFQNRQGRPLRGICVFAGSASSSNGPGYQASTRADGSYRLRGLAAGRYQISFGPGCDNNGNYLYQDYSRTVPVRLGRTVTGINAFLRPGGIATGTITDSHGAPLGGICVIVNSSGPGSSTISVSSGGGGDVSRADGTYRVTQITPGPATIEFANCQDQTSSYAPQFYPGQADPADAQPVLFRGGQVTSGLNAAMQPGGIISGTVTSAGGHPLDNVCAFAVAPGTLSASGFGSGGFGFYGQLNGAGFSSGGHYSILNLPPGQDQVMFSACGGSNLLSTWFQSAPGASAPDVINVQAAAPVAGVNAVLRPAGAISGKVTDATGKAPGVVCVSVTDRATGLGVAGLGVMTGTGYKVSGLAPGSYTVVFYACSGENLAMQWYRGSAVPGSAIAVTVTAGHTTGSISAALTAGGAITGQVTSKVTGKPVPNVCVLALSPSGQFVGFGVGDGAGQFRVNGLSTSSYDLTFADCLSASPVLAVQTLVRGVKVTTGRVTSGIKAQLGLGGTIAGTVLIGPASPVPARYACVDAIPVSSAANGAQPGYGQTDQNGKYQITGLVPGQYQVYLGDPGCWVNGGAVPQWYDGKASQGTATLVTVTASQVTGGVGGTLSVDGTISGTVTGPAPGKLPLAGVCLRAVPASPGGTPAFTATAADGQYQLAALAPGKYLVQFAVGCGATGYATQWWNAAASAAAATQITIAPDAKITGIDASMAP